MVDPRAVGRLMVDGLARPLHHEIRLRLGWRWLVQSGGAEIVVRENDPLLTLEVVDRLLDSGLQTFMPTRDLAPALQKAAAEVAIRVTARTYRQGTTEDELFGLADFLEQIRLGQDNSHLLSKLAEDTNLPAFLRLKAFAAMADPPSGDVLRAARVELDSANWRNSSACIQIFARATDTVSEVGAMLADDGVSESGKNRLLGAMNVLFADDEARRAAPSALTLTDGSARVWF